MIRWMSSKCAASAARSKCDAGKLVVIADCGHGVGPDLVTSFLDAHHCVVGFSPSREPLVELKDRFVCEYEAGIVDLWKCDLGDDKQVKVHAERMLTSHGTPDLVIVNLGALPRAWKRYHGSADADASATYQPLSVWDTRAEDWARMMGDVRGMAHVIRHFVPPMVKQGKGSVVTVMHALDPSWGGRTGVYRACRAAVEEVMHTTSLEIPEGMVAATVHPGHITYPASHGLGDTEQRESTSLGGDHPRLDSKTWAGLAVPFLLGLNPAQHQGGNLHVPFKLSEKQNARS